MTILNRDGMTLIELLVALIVAALTLAGATLLWLRLASVEVAIAQEATTSQASAGGERLLRRLVVAARDLDDGGTRFAGESASFNFDSRCPSKFGWPEPCRVVVGLTQSTASTPARMRVVAGTSESAFSLDLGSAPSFHYLTSASTEAQWTQRWASGLSAPIAVALVRAQDTLYFRVGVQP